MRTVSQASLLALIVAAGLLLMAQRQTGLSGAEPKSTKKGDQKEPSQEIKQVAHLTVANELMRLHWASWVSGKELRNIAEQTAKGINDQLENRPDVQFLLPEAKAGPRRLDAWEQQAVDDLRAGVAEVWHGAPERVVYVRAIRATATCVQCHRPLGMPRRELKEGDLLGIISVKLSR